MKYLVELESEEAVKLAVILALHEHKAEYLRDDPDAQLCRKIINSIKKQAKEYHDASNRSAVNPTDGSPRKRENLFNSESS